MLKKRVIAGIFVRNGWAVQSIGFSRYLPVGDPAILAETYDRWQVDEIVLADLSATERGTGPDAALVERVSAAVATPLTAIGGISSVDDVRAVIANGADKAGVNSAAYGDPQLLRRIADVYGRQCVVASIDAVRAPGGGDAGGHRLYCRTADVPDMPVADWALRLEDAGAGEILLNCVDRDGARTGFEQDLIAEVAARLTIPLIVLGGAGWPEDLRDVLSMPGVAAAGAGNIWGYSEHSVSYAKSWLADEDVLVRRDTDDHYRGRGLARDGRPMPPAETRLDSLLNEPLR